MDKIVGVSTSIHNKNNIINFIHEVSFVRDPLKFHLEMNMEAVKNILNGTIA